jgi:hypothetical protein
MTKSKKIIAGFEMFLMIGLSFAIAFMFSENFASAQRPLMTPDGIDLNTPTPAPPTPIPVPTSATADAFASMGTKDVFFGDQLYKGAEIYRFADSEGVMHIGTQLKGAGPVEWSEASQSWVKYSGEEGTFPALEESGALAGGASGNAIGAGTGSYRYSLLGIQFGGAVGYLVQGLVWSGVVIGILQVAKALGVDAEIVDSLSWAALGGIMTWKGIEALGPQGLQVFGPQFTQLAPFIGIGAGVAIFLLTYEKEKKGIVRFECNAWEPPTGGSDCAKCNENPLLPCSEYRCKSLGQACQIANPGEENEMCVWVNPQDTSPPKISPWTDALKPTGLRYVPDNTIAPPNTGVKIRNLDKECLQAFTPLEFGVVTDEPARCKIDYQLTDDYDNMSFPFGGSNGMAYNHTQKLKIPSPFSEESGENFIPEIHKDGTYTLYTRCIDANGNKNEAAFAFRFCVDDGPDAMQPIIEGFNIRDGQPVQFGVDSFPIEVYTNEPAECKWSRQDKAFDDMENTMTCARYSYQITNNLTYACSGTLTGIKDRESNKFYFRCKDYATPNRNVMSVSKPLTLKGSEELIITSVGPNGTIEGGQASAVTVNLQVETSRGADEGKATCYFSENNEDSESFVPMYGSGGFAHNHSLDLTAGSYQYYFKCVDAGGNAAYADTIFTVKIDNAVPKTARVYRDGDTLMVVTNEPAKCAYSLTSCNFALKDGQSLFHKDAAKKTEHYTEWNPGITYYIICQDLNGNQPSPNVCSVIAEGSEL